MTDRLKLYNGALLLAGDREIASLTVNEERRRDLDLVWNDGGVRFCLEQAIWHFALRAARFDYDATFTADWGYSRRFEKPEDWVTTAGVWEDEFLRTPLTQYSDEVGFWFSDRDEIFVKYLSDDESYGQNLSKWPATFVDYVKAYFAGRISHKVGGGKRVEFLLGPAGREDKGHVNRTLLIAKNKSAMTQPATFPTRGTWVRARHAGQHGPNRDGGSTTNLIG